MVNASPALALVLAAFTGRAPAPAVPQRVPDTSAAIAVRRAAGPIALDGRLDDPGWAGAARVTTFYEASPGNNVRPPVRTTAWITYDSRYLYVAFRCDDPRPSDIRAPAVDRDGIAGNQDFVAIGLDTRGDRQSALLLLVNAAGAQGDGVRNDGTGNEDFSPDFFWSAAARITGTGWAAEMRIPVASLRYTAASLPKWGILFYRNYPRAYRYQLFSAPMPRGSNCEICHATAIEGLQGLSAANHLIIAPYTAGQKEWRASGTAGEALTRSPARWQNGMDVKWSPGGNNVVDLTLHPDFSQVEADQVQITANQRFALFYPEKRPFFMEGVDLLQTPIGAAYTRTVTAPRWGARVTGRLAGADYTFLTAMDDGGGSVVVPGPQGSGLAFQDFSSQASVLRVRRTIGESFTGLLVTDRENDGGSYNRVIGPDFQWSPGPADKIIGQALFSTTRTPNRPDLLSQWDGRRLSGTGVSLSWTHDTRNWSWRTEYGDVATAFRAQDGFVPRVGYRSLRQQVEYNAYPSGLLTRVVPTVIVAAYWDRSGTSLEKTFWPGFQLEGRKDFQADVFYKSDAERLGDVLLRASRLSLDAALSLSRMVPQASLSATLGQGFDYANQRVGHGGAVSAAINLRPFGPLGLTFQVEHQWLDSARAGQKGHLYAADAGGLQALWPLSSKAFVRIIAQFIETRRDPLVYSYAVSPRDGNLQGSFLFSYKLNWQTALYAGYSDERTLTAVDSVIPAERQVFVKLSYAFRW